MQSTVEEICPALSGNDGQSGGSFGLSGHLVEFLGYTGIMYQTNNEGTM